MTCPDCGANDGFGQFSDPLNPRVAKLYCENCGEVVS